MKYYQMTTQQIKEHFNVDTNQGLSQQEANKRLLVNGTNELDKPKRRLLILRFFDQLKDFMILILFVASILSFVTNDIAEGILVIAIVLINAVLGLIQESKAEKALLAIQKLATPHSKVRRDGIDMIIDVSQLVVGDLVIIEAGDYIPADLRIIESINLKVDESTLTGESVPVLKKSSVLQADEVALGDRINSAYMSTVATYGRGLGIVVRTGMDTEIGKIAKMIAVAKNDLTPLQQSIKKLGKILAIVAIVITLVIFGINMMTHYYFEGNAIGVGWEVWKDSLMRSVALAVAAIPEGLPAIITITLALGMQSLAKQKAIMKSLPAVETLGSTSIICSDKTGTLTQNIMTVTHIYVNDQIIEINEDTSFNQLEKLISFGVLCNDSKVSIDHDNYVKFGDPTELALINLAINSNFNLVEIINDYPRVFELPFDSQRKLMTTVHDINNKRYAIIKGAPDVMASRAINQKEELTSFEQANIKMTLDALRVLAIGYKEIDQFTSIDDLTNELLENEITLLGLFGMVDPPRLEVKEAITTSNRAGIEVIMITGDHKNTALAIAKDLNIIKTKNDIAISGLELDQLSDQEFMEQLEHIKVYARVSPENKVRIVNAWKKHGNIVAMTGDGVNDAPALKAANIGIAMGNSGTEVTKGAADMVLADDNFTTIVNAVGEGRGIYANIKKAIHFLLSCNTGEIITILLGTILGSLIFGTAITTLTAVQILWVNLVTDSLMAIAIGLEPREDDIMDEKPRDNSKSFFANGLGFKILWHGSLLGILSFAAFTIGYFIHMGTVDDKLLNASTMTFMVLAITQLFHAFNIKSETKSIFKTKVNKFLIYAFFISLTLQLLTITFGFTRQLFDLSSLNFIEWLIVIGLAITPVIVVELQKLIKNIINKKRA